MRETLRTRYPLQERSGNFLLVAEAPTAAQGLVNGLHIGLSQLTLQVLVPSSAQVLKWKWDMNIFTSQCLNDNHMTHTVCTNMNTNSPVKLAWIRRWNSLPSHIVHTIKGTGNAFTGDGWTALIQKELRLRGHLFSVWTSAELISILQGNGLSMSAVACPLVGLLHSQIIYGKAVSEGMEDQESEMMCSVCYSRLVGYKQFH